MNTHTFLSCFFLGLACSIIAVTIIVIMPKEMILNWWFRFGEHVGKRIIDGMEQERWFYRPMWGCHKCFAGQLAAWSFLVLNFRHYNCFHHLLAVCVAILSSVFISFFTNQILNKDDNAF